MALDSANASVASDHREIDFDLAAEPLQAIERVFVINLARRKDRWEQFQARLPATWPFRKPERVDAIDGSRVTHPATWKSGSGAWGCYRTHLNILETCLNEQVDSVLILEDDAVCCDDFLSGVTTFFKYLPPDWSLVYLGGQHLECRRALPLKVNDFVYRPFNVNRSHAMVIRGSKAMTKIYHHVLSHHEWTSRHHIDHQLGELHKDHWPGIYVPHKWLVQQYEGQSDINGGFHGETDFPGAETLVREEINVPTVAVLGPPSKSAYALRLMLQEMGVSMGRRKQHEDQTVTFADGELRTICNEMFAKPFYARLEGRAACIRKLKRWAAMVCYSSRHWPGPIGGCHPAFCLLGPELLEAWPDIRFLVLSESAAEARDEDETYVYVRRTLHHAREQFLSEFSPLSLRIDASQLNSEQTQTRQSIQSFLGIPRMLM